MTYIDKAKSWIIRQAKQPTSWGGSVLASVAMIWQFAGNDVSSWINGYQSNHPILVIFGKIAVGLIGLVCIIYNENHKDSDNNNDN